ncbi:MAG: GTP-binding protein, partial [Cyclobacteriaceae bacterium]
KELNGVHTPETEEYGINSFVFRDHRPFHPERLWNFIQSEFPTNIIRSKGIFWLASRPDHALLWGQAGGSTQAEVYGKWWASVPEADRRKSRDFLANQKELQKKWSSDWGDRLNELVFIGQALDEALVTARLQTCLLTESEIVDFKSGSHFADRWPL